MLELVNRTPFAAGLLPMWNREAQPVALLVVKCTFEVDCDQVTSPAEQQVPLCLADEYYGEPERTSIRAANDLALYKPAVDLAIVGSFYAPPGTAVQQLNAGLMIGKAVRRLQVTGDRTWIASVFDYRATAPAPFERMPINYERSYGGADLDSVELRNPVGRGYRARDAEVDGCLLPNIEWEDAPLQHWKERPEPAGLGFVAPSWLPRSQYGGTYDDYWLQHRMPFLPQDFDYRHFQAASPRLTFPVLQAGDPIVLESMTPDGPFACRVPEVRLAAVYRHDRERGEVELRRDTVVIEPDQRRVILVFRAMIHCHQNHLALRQVLLGDLTPGMKQAFLSGKKYRDNKAAKMDGSAL